MTEDTPMEEKTVSPEAKDAAQMYANYSNALDYARKEMPEEMPDKTKQLYALMSSAMMAARNNEQLLYTLIQIPAEEKGRPPYVFACGSTPHAQFQPMAELMSAIIVLYDASPQAATELCMETARYIGQILEPIPAGVPQQ